MDNALQVPRGLNYSKKTEVWIGECKQWSPSNSPEKERGDRPLGIEQRVLSWFHQKGIRRGEPCAIHEQLREVQRKRIAEER